MSSFELYGLILAGGVLAVALLLGGWHWAESRAPAPALSADDVTHYARQDRRRRVVATIMTALGLLILVGSQTSHKAGARPNPVFIAVWLTVTGLVVVLLVLAVLDWQATRRYARRHRSAIVREGMELLKEEMRRRAAPPPDGNGRARGGRDA